MNNTFDGVEENEQARDQLLLALSCWVHLQILQVATIPEDQHQVAESQFLPQHQSHLFYLHPADWLLLLTLALKSPKEQTASGPKDDVQAVHSHYRSR